MRETLGHNRYYLKFIKGYTMITSPMEKILKKDVKFVLEQDPAATEEAANFGGKREVLAKKGQGRATTP